MEILMTSIIIATDGSLSAERAVHIGADIAKSRKADVCVVSVLDGRPIPESIIAMAETEHLVDQPAGGHIANIANVPTWIMEGVRAAAQTEEMIDIRHAVADLAMEKARTILGEAGVTSITEQVSEGDAADIILQAAARQGAEMIVMGTRGLGALKSLIMGSTSKQVAAQADCPCVTVT